MTEEFPSKVGEREKMSKEASAYGPDRPGKITSRTILRWDVGCELCTWTASDYISYQDASIRLTSHLEDCHPGWEKKLHKVKLT